MKSFLFVILIMFALSVYADCEDPQGVGYDTMGHNSDAQSIVNYDEDDKIRIGNEFELNGCGEEEQTKITVYGYAPNFGGFGGMIGITFALNLSGGGGGYIASVQNNVGCNTDGSLDFANAAFRVYRTQYINDTNLGTFLRDHEVDLSDPQNPVYVEWDVEFPDGSIGTYEINAPSAAVPLNGNAISCTPAP